MKPIVCAVLGLLFCLQLSGNARAAEAPAGRDEFEQGHYHFVMEEFPKAEEWFRKAAAKGNIISMTYLGQICQRGFGGRQVDLEEAVSWFRKAGEKGEPLAMGILVRIYTNGEGSIEKNPAEAAQWAERQQKAQAAQQAKIAKTGEAAKSKPSANKPASKKTTTASADNGSADYNKGIDFYQNKKTRQAFASFKLAAEKGHAKAMYNLGVMTATGEGTTKNYREAIDWYISAAEKNDPAAMHNLAAMFYNGQGVNADPEKAKEWFQKAAALNNPGSKEALKALEEALAASSFAIVATAPPTPAKPVVNQNVPFCGNNGLYGLINRSGKIIIPAQYESIGKFGKDGIATIRKDKKEGLIDNTGKEIIPPIYKSVDTFRDGLAIVTKSEHDGNHLHSISGYLNRQGEIAIPFSDAHAESYGFSDGLALLIRDGKLGYIDTTGKEVIPPQFKTAQVAGGNYFANFTQGVAVVTVDGLNGLIDKSGKVLTSKGYASIAGNIQMFVDDNRPWEGIFTCRTVDEKVGYLKTDGTELIPPGRYRYTREFREGLGAVANQNDKWGFIDKEGKEVIPLRYDNVREFKDGLAGVEVNGKWGYIDRTGKEVIAPKFSKVSDFSEGLAPVQIGAKDYAYINDKGEICIILKGLDRFPKEFNEGLAVFKKVGRFGAINKKGEIVVNPIYVSFGFFGRFEDAVINAETFRKQWVTIDATGKELRAE